MATLDTRLAKLEAERELNRDVRTMSMAELERELIQHLGYMPTLEELTELAEEGDENPGAAA